MPSSIEMLNGLFSLVKYGLSDCMDDGNDHGFALYPGFGSCRDNGQFERAIGTMEYQLQATSTEDIIDELATLVTAGRLSKKNREIIASIYDAELNNIECGSASLRKQDYRGVLSTSRDGYTCQKWTSQTPNSHSYTPENYPDAGLGDHNYCRNPNPWRTYTWCYITDHPSGSTWQRCEDIPECGDEASARRLALQAMLATPEFHSTTPIKTVTDKARPAASKPTGASGPVSDYKAIVYLFFEGGADTFNMLPPYPGACPAENDLYAKYSAIRENVALTAADMRMLSVTNHHSKCTAFGLHKSLGLLKELYDNEAALFVANTGLLAKPVDKNNYKFETGVQLQLFSHSDMSKESKALDLDREVVGTGIIGRLADALNGDGYSCGTYSIAGNQIALVGEPGNSPSPIVLSDSGLKAFDPQSSTEWLAKFSPNLDMTEIVNAVNNATAADSSLMAETWSLKVTEALEQHSSLYSALESASTTNAFPTSGLGKKLSMVAKLMQKRAERGKDRDIFYVSIGGWDMHSYVIDGLESNFATVDAALDAFVKEVKDMGLWSDTTLMQFSEFARTLDPNSGPRGDGTGAGSDHGWGGNNFMLGGSVKGGQILGTYPDEFTENGPRALSRGRMLPTTPWDAMWNGVAEWFGVPASEMDKVMPHRQNFMPENLLFDKDDLFKP
mmetsp:Transcript_8174/g.18379  ORF Transcript_8174/g.18379 Transcript_8174/m.18379 type:complete len:673 (-) Transcript_8174:81-2099(-)